METKVFSIRHSEEELSLAREFCKKNVTTLPLQIRELIKRLANGEIILNGKVDEEMVNE